MDISRKLGILVFCMVPAIVGGGIVFGFAHNYVAVAIWEVIVLGIAGIFVSR